MALKYGKNEIKAMIAAIDNDEHESAEDAAKAALAAAEEIFEDRAKFVVVGQLRATKERLSIPPADGEAIKVSLGWYSTEGDAISAAGSLWSNTATGDNFRCWVLPVFHGTPAAFHDTQKAKYAEAEAKRAEKAKEKFLESIVKHREAMEERARSGKGSCKTCGHMSGDHAMTSEGNKGRGVCRMCECPKWEERTK